MVRNKKISRNRSVTIHKDIAAQSGITAGAAVDLIDADDCIIIKRHIPVCFFCGKDIAANSGLRHMSKDICTDCYEELRKEYDKYYGENSKQND